MPSDDLPYTNQVYVSQNNYKQLSEYSKNTVRSTSDDVYLRFGNISYIVKPLTILNDDVICLNQIQRNEINAQIDKDIAFEVVKFTKINNKKTKLYVLVDSFVEPPIKIVFNYNELVQQFQLFDKQVFSVNQMLCMKDTNDIKLKLKIINGKEGKFYQYCAADTRIIFIPKDSYININTEKEKEKEDLEQKNCIDIL